MTKSFRSALRRRRVAVLLATATVAASFGWALAPVSTSAQTAAPPFTVEFGQTTGLIDGEEVRVTVRADAGVRLATSTGVGQILICRPGVSYTSVADINPTNGNCPGVRGAPSTSSEGSAPLYAVSDGTYAEGRIAVGVGVAEWPLGFGLGNGTLECGPSAPCLLVVHLRQEGGGAATDHFVTHQISFGDTDPAGQCGGTNPAALRSGGSDRMLDLWSRLTVAHCTSGGSTGTATRLAPDGEGAGITGFAEGDDDLAYTASGYRQIQGLQVEAERDAVYVPVALNAVVLAAVGGQFEHSDPSWPVGLAKPYSDPIRMTAAEAATLLGQSGFFFASTAGVGDSFLARNPQIGSAAYNPQIGQDKVAANPDASAVTLYATTYLDERAPGQWVSRPVDGTSRGVSAQLGVADPDFASAVEPMSQKSLLRKFSTFFNQSSGYPGPGWVLTDYATAVDLGLTPVAIQNAAGEFVQPSPESIAAGLASMTEDADGRLVPDPNAVAPGAYPLTMVEYAMAPAEPLVDTACARRSESQALMTSWLSFVTGPGQAALAPDFVPLTPELAAEAAQQIALVGASASTASCAPIGPLPPTIPGGTVPPASSPVGGTGSSSFGSRSGLGGSGSADAAAAAFSQSTPEELDGAQELAEAAEPKLPPFLGVAAVSELISPVALLLVVVLTSGAAFLTSGRPMPPALASGARRVGSGASRVVRRIPFPRRR
jgi:hypothetical protein